jgi:hypothetical protein
MKKASKENINAREALENARSYLDLSRGSNIEFNSAHTEKFAQFALQVRDSQFAEYVQSHATVICSLEDLDRIIEHAEDHGISKDEITPLSNVLEQPLNMTAAQAKELKDKFQIDGLKCKIDLCDRLLKEYGDELFSEEAIDKFLEDMFGFSAKELQMPDVEPQHIAYSGGGGQAVSSVFAASAVGSIEEIFTAEQKAILSRLNEGMDLEAALIESLYRYKSGGTSWSPEKLISAAIEFGLSHENVPYDYLDGESNHSSQKAEHFTGSTAAVDPNSDEYVAISTRVLDEYMTAEAALIQALVNRPEFNIQKIVAATVAFDFAGEHGVEFYENLATQLVGDAQ